MVGVVIKLEATTVDPYGTPKVVGTHVTVEHTVYVGKDNDKVKKVETKMFFPPNSVLPHIGDDVDISMEIMV